MTDKRSCYLHSYFCRVWKKMVQYERYIGGKIDKTGQTANWCSEDW